MKKKQTNVILLCIGFMAINLRLPITAIPPLLPSLEKATGLPVSAAGLLTTIPLLTFAILSPVLAKLGRRFGNERVIFSFAILLVLGSMLRINTALPTILIGTFLIGLGIDSANVLLPAVIKDHLPLKPMLGVSTYTTTMLLVGALGTGLAGIIVAKASLLAAMVGLAIISVISLIGWTPMIKQNKLDSGKIQRAEQSGLNTQSVWKSSMGWMIAFFFGLQSLIYYSLITWLPTIFVAKNFSSIQGGTFVTIMQIGSLPCAFIVPFLADKRGGDAVLVWVAGLGFSLGILALMFPISSATLVSIISLVVGIASGIAFNLSIVYFAQKSANAMETAEVSGMAQTVGYLLAAVGPVLFGYLHAGTHSWTIILTSIIVLSVFLLLTGIYINHKPSVFEKIQD
ncbi:MFS transporter [Secundilactobacillus malefermentans]|nr:MFS transporter [Secundilactobacillus malefermentans]QEA32419.1 MFS transporter [Secundilactobacillus malefermentans]